MIYVDELREYPNAPRIRGQATTWCQMSADSDDELEEFARQLGLRESWGQEGHYDITKYKRGIAVACGAKQITSREMVRVRNRLCPDKMVRTAIEETK